MVSPKRIPLLRDLEAKIGYRFSNLELLEEAVTHDSFVNEQINSKLKGNERLEFLGDAVLELVVSSKLYSAFPDFYEGKLTQMRSFLVSRDNLAEVARKLGLGDYLNLGQGEDSCGGREKNSILVAALEAIFGAIYLDGGLLVAEKVIMRQLEPTIGKVAEGKEFDDPKSLLQEFSQEHFKKLPVYQIISETGPDHDRVFRARVSLSEPAISAEGEGKSKKSAEQAAARKLYEELANTFKP